jgi:hypothetical protein
MNYYYLIAYLPKLSLEGPLPTVDVADTMHFVQRNLDTNDQLLIKYLIYPNDNQNLTSLIFEKYHNCSLPVFRTPSIYTSDELRHSLKKEDGLPGYILDFISKYKEKFRQLSPGMISEYLWMEFYREVSTLDNSFIIEYYRFDKLLRQMAAAHSFNDFEESVPTEFVNDQMIKDLELNKSLEFLTKIYPFIEKLWDSLDSRNPLIIESNMDVIRWEFIDNYEMATSFSNCQLFGWVIKLIHYSRWISMSKEKGKSHFEKLCDEAILNSGISEIEKL